MVNLVLLSVAVLMGIGVFRFGRDADWHWSVALLVGLVPVGFTWFLGLLGLIIGGLFFASMWKAQDAL